MLLEIVQWIVILLLCVAVHYNIRTLNIHLDWIQEHEDRLRKRKL